MPDSGVHWKDELAMLPGFSTRGAGAFRPGLETMASLLQYMGNPQQAYPCVHVAGTNGKGSTASLLSSIGTATGRQMGLHTSPHLCHVGERMRINGTPASDQWLSRAVHRYRSLFTDVRASFFEATTALSLLYFANHNADCAVIETGLGGRLDATNVIVPVLSIITSIDLDHTDILGRTIREIAAEKGGIIKPGVPVLARCGKSAATVLKNLADKHGAAFYATGHDVEILQASPHGQTITVQTPSGSYRRMPLNLAGTHQADNAVLAIRAAELVFTELTSFHVSTGLRDVVRLSGLRARLEPIQAQPLIVVDVAHNPSSLAAALRHMRSFCKGALLVLFAAMRDKDVSSMASTLAESRVSVLACSLASPRAMDLVTLTPILNKAGVSIIFSGTAAAAWRHAHRTAAEGDGVLVAGSHQLVELVLQQAEIF